MPELFAFVLVEPFVIVSAVSCVVVLGEPRPVLLMGVIVMLELVVTVLVI